IKRGVAVDAQPIVAVPVVEPTPPEPEEINQEPPTLTDFQVFAEAVNDNPAPPAPPPEPVAVDPDRDPVALSQLTNTRLKLMAQRRSTPDKGNPNKETLVALLAGHQT